MRLLYALFFDLFVLLKALLLAPLRLAGKRQHFYIAVELKRDVPWRTPGRRLLAWRRRRSPFRPSSLKNLEQKLELAEGDPRVRGVVIHLEDFQGPGIELEAVRRMVERLRQAGKEVVFYGRVVSMREYGLMVSGSQVQLAPGGLLDLKGYSAQMVVLGETLEKAGVRAHFLRRGAYKTAPELFTDREVSEPQRKTVEEILLQLFDTAVSAIAKGRSLAPERIKRLVDQGPFTAAHALAHRLIDGVADAEELESLLAGKGEKKARFRPLASYGGPMLQLLRSELKPLLPAPQIGVVSVDGVIKIGENVHLPFAPRAAGSDSVVEALRRARESDRVKAIVLAIDSRGGSFLASELIFRAVRRAAQAKPVVAYFDRAAASGGYLAAVGANYIVAGPGALTGSIGIFGGKFELSRLLERLGVGRAEIELGKNAGVYSTLKPWSESERAALDALLESNYRDFVSAVAVARHLSADAVARCAEGRVFTGQRARELGLVDEVGSFEDAVALAARLAQISGTPEVESWDMPVHALSAIAGLHGWADVAKLIQPLEAERVFAAAESWLEIEPRP